MESFNQVKIRVFCYCCKMWTICQGSNLFICWRQNTRLLTASHYPKLMLRLHWRHNITYIEGFFVSFPSVLSTMTLPFNCKIFCSIEPRVVRSGETRTFLWHNKNWLIRFDLIISEVCGLKCGGSQPRTNAIKWYWPMPMGLRLSATLWWIIWSATKWDSMCIHGTIKTSWHQSKFVYLPSYLPTYLLTYLPTYKCNFVSVKSHWELHMWHHSSGHILQLNHILQRLILLYWSLELLTKI